MSHRKISPAARRALLARFAPDGYVLVTILDQTIGYLVDTEWSTIVHREATLYPTREAAEVGRLRYMATWSENLTASINDAETGEETREFHVSLLSRIDTMGPWIEPVPVWAHFCDRPDTW